MMNYSTNDSEEDDEVYPSCKHCNSSFHKPCSQKACEWIHTNWEEGINGSVYPIEAVWSGRQFLGSWKLAEQNPIISHKDVDSTRYYLVVYEGFSREQAEWKSEAELGFRRCIREYEAIESIKWT
jgi:hypothetical protein